MILSIVFNTNNTIEYKSFIRIQFNGFKHCYIMFKILFDINHLFAHIYMVYDKVN